MPEAPRRADIASLRARILLALAPTGLIAIPIAGCSPPSTNVETVEPGQPTGTVATASPTTAPTSTGTPTATATADPVAVPGCAQPREQCFTHDQLVELLRNPPRGGSLDPVPGETRRASFLPGDPAESAQWDKNGCLPPTAVHNGCCNPASAGPTFKGGQCCYSFCEGACCGRPLVVDGAPRVAHVLARSDWGGAAHARSSLDEATRAALASAWLEDARMEHASVASFARFALELLSVGAPADLVAAAHRAAQDEIRHAELGFAIASRFAGAPVGPAALDLHGAKLAEGLPEIVAAVVREGCVGETLAALLASEAASAATDPFIRDALRTIAADEASHAELAWRFLRWAIDRGGDATREAATRAFQEAQRGIGLPAGAPVGTDVAAWRAHGRLGAAEARAVAVEVMEQIVLPAAAMAL